MLRGEEGVFKRREREKRGMRDAEYKPERGARIVSLKGGAIAPDFSESN